MNNNIRLSIFIFLLFQFTFMSAAWFGESVSNTTIVQGGSWFGQNAFRTISVGDVARDVGWFGQALSLNVSVAGAKECVWTCGEWSSCLNGKRTRTCTALPVGCTGDNPDPIEESCVDLTDFKNPFDLAVNAITTDQKEQCVWCDYYYPNNANKVSLGKSGKLDFSFTYSSNNTVPMKSYAMILTSSTLDPNTASIPNNQKIQFTVNGVRSPGSTMTIAGINVSRGVAAITNRTLPYDGKTYHWWIKVVDNNNVESEWVPANKSLVIPDHQWPSPAIGGLVSTYSKENKFLGYTVCSTMADVSVRYSQDPCYSSCWEDRDANGNRLNTKPIVGDSRWKCSVCYNNQGKAVLCDYSNFKWNNITSLIGEFNKETNIYNLDRQNRWRNDNWVNRGGQDFFNPIVNFKDSLSVNNIMGLRIRGSECPAEGLTNAKEIRPIWRE